MASGSVHYHDYDFILALLFHQRQRSRKEVAEHLSLGEGSVKALLNELKKRHLLHSTNKGHAVTEKGRKIADGIARVLTVNASSSTLLFRGLKEAAIIIHDPNRNLYQKIYKSRDEVIRQGAEDALFVIRKNNRFVLPPVDYTEKKFSVFDRLFTITEKDLLILSYAKEKRTALLGAMAGAMSVSLSLKKILDTAGA